MSDGALTRLQSLGTFLRKNKASFVDVLPSHLSAERLSRIVFTEARKNPKLLACSQESFLGAIIQSAQLGLEPGSALGHCWLLPFASKSEGMIVQLHMGYKGMIDIAMRSGKVSRIVSRVVYEGDDFSVAYGLDENIDHIPNLSSSKDKKITHVYAICFLKDGDKLFDVMNIGEIEQARQSSKSPNSSAWNSYYGEMARKTVIRRLFKYSPVSRDIQTAVSLDEAAEAGNSQKNKFIFSEVSKQEDDSAFALESFESSEPNETFETPPEEKISFKDRPFPTEKK